jgi:hypothetical protein
MQQSAFELARSFLFRGRKSAYRAKDQALINISLSGEFHLHRYLETEEALRMAVRQHNHAKDYAPPRSRLHAEINEAVAQWALQGPVAPAGIIGFLESARAVSERNGFGHLVPRIDYLKALDAYHRLERGNGAVNEVHELISATKRSALRYGYGEYNWLAENLRLLQQIDMAPDSAVVENTANHLIAGLMRDGLTFIAEDFLCYQNVVVLSNALRALYSFTDEVNAWKASEQVNFSPLICLTKEDREQRLRAVFAGDLLCQQYDPRAVSLNRQGYFTILA